MQDKDYFNLNIEEILMQKSLLALALLGAFAGAQAQTAPSNVTVYGLIDLGLTHSTGAQGSSMNNGDNSRLGFKGSENLGGTLSADFMLEIRLDANTGVNEGNGARPLFQGRSWVGLSDNSTWGQVRFGRDLTPEQVTGYIFDPWHGSRARGTLYGAAAYSNGIQAGYNPSADDCNCRWSNAVFYNSPDMGGFKIAAATQTKQASTSTNDYAGKALQNDAVSINGLYDRGPIKAALIYEKNAIGDEIVQAAGLYDFGVANISASYARNTPGIITDPTGNDRKAFAVASTIPVNATNHVLLAYVDNKPDVGSAAKTFSAGFEHYFSKRTFVYTDFVNTTSNGATTINTFDVGIDHKF
jgi:predicted porin